MPNDKVAYEAFAVIRDAMEKEDLVGLARVVLYRRERILMLQPRGKGLMATALRYNTEVRDENNYFDEIPTVKVPADMLDLAMHILKSKKAKFDPDKFEDRYETALSALIKAKQAGKPAPKASRAEAEQRDQPDGRACARASTPKRAARARRRARPAPATAAPRTRASAPPRSRSKVKRAALIFEDRRSWRS